ncbi:STAS domain-containing protein [Nonomuraea aridisoli]|uniref:Anti-sigma factor antagonist n=1 Tax=Nonomuraea aridisoli TaxID=2070368 RepID=A0A2W2EBP3_9ACTN|nr:STAS domain-containing protein [Nonomuraea aridisoli]PZG19943.1 hypothetical protein C1J01_10940 [Nonomuraea aridisoli]
MRNVQVERSPSFIVTPFAVTGSCLSRPATERIGRNRTDGENTITNRLSCIGLRSWRGRRTTPRRALPGLRSRVGVLLLRRAGEGESPWTKQTAPGSSSACRSACTTPSSWCATGELDYASSNDLHQQAKDAWQKTPSQGLVLDLGGVTFCDSTGVGVLVQLLKQGREQNSTLVLASIPPRLERLLSITGLRAAFRVEPSLERAIEALQEAPVRRRPVRRRPVRRRPVRRRPGTAI